jgi:hypothetical protein
MASREEMEGASHSTRMSKVVHLFELG